MSGRHREVVHHRHRGHLDGPVDGQCAVGVGPVIADVRLKEVAVAEEMQFPGGGTDLRMRRHRIVELAVEVVAADRLQIIGDLVGQRRLDQGQGLAGMADDMGVGHRRAQIAGAVGVVDRKGVVEAVGADPAIAVPLGRPALDADTVDHPVADEPVPGRRAGVGPVAQVPAVQLRWDRSLDGQVVHRQLVGHRGVVAPHVERTRVGQVGQVVGDVGHGPTVPSPARTG